MIVADRDLHDSTLLDEIEMYGELVIAASTCEGRLPAARIDAILGVGPADRRTSG
jgi:hypothetical protein